MRFADGTVERLKLVEGFVLYEVPRARTTPQRRPISVTTYDRAGLPLVREELGGFGQIVRQQRRDP